MTGALRLALPSKGRLQGQCIDWFGARGVTVARTGDDRLARCHDVAVAAVLDCIERYGSTTRVRVDGRRLHPESNGLTAAVFRQTTSRLDDPQLHSHVVISAKVQTPEGRWLALDARVLKGFQRAVSSARSTD